MANNEVAISVLKKMWADYSDSKASREELYTFKLDKIAEHQGLTYQQVKKCLNDLEHMGYITPIDLVDDSDLHIQRFKFTPSGLRIIRGN